MKLKYFFEMMDLDDQVIAIPVGEGSQKFHGVVKLNNSAQEIFNLLSEDTTEEKIICALKERYGDDSDIPVYVHQMIDYLKEEGVLD